MSRIWLNLPRPSRTPSASGSAPPDSDVPAPRGTTLTPCRWQYLRTLRDLLGRRRQHDDHRQLPIGGQSVGFIDAHLVLLDDDAFARYDGP